MIKTPCYRYLWVAIVVFGCTGYVAPASFASETGEHPPFFASPGSALREVEHTIISAHDAASMTVAPGADDIEKKFTIARLRYRQVAESFTVSNTKAFYAAAEDAHNSYPDSMALAGLYGYATLFYRGPVEALQVLVPVADRWDAAPGIPLAIYRSLDTIISTVETMPESADLSRYFSGDKATVLLKAETLARLWAGRIRREDARRLYTPKLAQRAEATLDEEQQTLAANAWDEILTKHKVRRAREIIEAQREREFEEQQESTKRSLAKSEHMANEAFNRAVESLLALRKGDRSLRELEMTLSSLQRFRTRLRKEYPHVPHYNVFQGDESTRADADMIDAAYQLSVMQYPQSALACIHKIPSWEKDTRALYLAAFASFQIKDWDEAERLVKLLIEQNSKDYRAKRFLLTIEEARENNPTTQPVTSPAK